MGGEYRICWQCWKWLMMLGSYGNHWQLHISDSLCWCLILNQATHPSEYVDIPLETTIRDNSPPSTECHLLTNWMELCQSLHQDVEPLVKVWPKFMLLPVVERYIYFYTACKAIPIILRKPSPSQNCSNSQFFNHGFSHAIRLSSHFLPRWTASQCIWRSCHLRRASTWLEGENVDSSSAWYLLLSSPLFCLSEIFCESPPHLLLQDSFSSPTLRSSPCHNASW